MLAWLVENEIKAIKELLELLEIYGGCIITIDAMGTQTEIARRFVAQRRRLRFVSSKPSQLITGEKLWSDIMSAIIPETLSAF